MASLIGKRYIEVNNFVDDLLFVFKLIMMEAASFKNQRKIRGTGARGLNDIAIDPEQYLWEGEKKEAVRLALSLSIFDTLKKNDFFKLFCKDYSIDEIALHMKEKLSITNKELDMLKLLHNEKDYFYILNKNAYIPYINSKLWLLTFTSIGLFFLSSVPKEFVEFFKLSFSNYIVTVSFAFFIVILILAFLFISQWRKVNQAKFKYKLLKSLLIHCTFYSDKDDGCISDKTA